jgi:hypothetical protein
MRLGTGGYVGVWDLSIAPGAVFCRAVPNLKVTIRNFFIAIQRPLRRFKNLGAKWHTDDVVCTQLPSLSSSHLGG